MKNLLLIVTLVLSFASPLVADDKSASAPADPKKAEMMKKMMEAGTPGAPHKVLEQMAGSWNVTSKWWETADAKPEESKGKSKMTMMFGGRFLKHEMKGKAMGMPFEGIGLMGFDNVAGKYQSLWTDSMSTAMMLAEGTYDSATNTINDSGEFSCPVSETKKAKYRGEWKIVDRNKMVFSMYGNGMDGKSPEFKHSEMTFTRAK